MINAEINSIAIIPLPENIQWKPTIKTDIPSCILTFENSIEERLLSLFSKSLYLSYYIDDNCIYFKLTRLPNIDIINGNEAINEHWNNSEGNSIYFDIDEDKSTKLKFIHTVTINHLGTIDIDNWEKDNYLIIKIDTYL